MNNMELARFNMVEQQIRPWDVLDGNVLDLLRKVKREHFVPVDKQSMAFMDVEIPLGHGVKMWFPKVEARVLQALKLKASDRVLEIGTGSGYLTALMSRMAQHVTSVELVQELSARAARTLAAHHYDNVTLEVGDASRGWGNEKYDAIVLTGSVPLPPESFYQMLNTGGRLFAIVGDAPAMHATLVSCVAPGVFETTVLFETSVALLTNAPQPQRFSF
ncbi:protein-L-isoaspartate O-methyltransferase [Sideroxydans sp. CL21]|jgi:protein-L-isoaspartate(D-aspartate) O-methyltransferase|uniref:protein-L-isoaspartate O-methyltransferase family protein n=1 Tax=Sideroxydans sp. CL21 TaxID=2600596 RepID=UPI0024BCD27E|nr:protein-L-isoaspartate O-methyltransferase [Sideroxydans sp. CL21]